MKLSGYQVEAVERLIEPHKPTPTFACFDVPGALGRKDCYCDKCASATGSFPRTDHDAVAPDPPVAR